MNIADKIGGHLLYYTYLNYLQEYKMTFKKVYETAILGNGKITLDGQSYVVIEGKHCIWIPELEIKIPWTFNGKI
jgi:hypothetical protein